MLESKPAHWFNCICREFRRFPVCHKKLLNVLKLVKCNIYFRHKFGFPFHIYKCVANANLNNIYCYIETTTWIKTEESPQCKFYYDTGDLSIRFFSYHSNDTKRNPSVMLCSHCPINDSSGYLHNTVYLAVMLQASWHTAEGN